MIALAPPGDTLSGAPEPAAQRTLRLVQMRRQAERFRVAVGSNRAWSETRLLPQPIFRAPVTAVTDTAVFVFAQGTDPECVLSIEATPEKKWRFALTRQTKWGLRAELDGLKVWEAAPTGRPEVDPQTPFLVITQTPTADGRSPQP